MSQGVLIADEQTILRTAENPAVGTLSERKVKSKLSVTTYKIVKRTCDIFFGIIGSVFIIPLAIIVKLAYVVTGDFGSIIYSQKRIGKDGKEFTLLKFRSMVKNADLILVELLEKEPYKSEWAKFQKLHDDPRISKIGKFLRKTSLDEVPQFINILKGDMSLVGPRPLVKGELNEHCGDHELYESVRPGLTSWWAANGRSGIDYNTRLEQEYYYVENASLSLDLLCIAKTAKGVLTHEGAN